eukprot:3472833-Karenia_brevis.AAC.1
MLVPEAIFRQARGTEAEAMYIQHLPSASNRSADERCTCRIWRTKVSGSNLNKFTICEPELSA